MFNAPLFFFDLSAQNPHNPPMSMSEMQAGTGLSGSCQRAGVAAPGHLSIPTLLHARIPRVDCPDHGVLQVEVPWAEARSRFAFLMERFAIEMLEQCVTVLGAGRILRLSWDEVWGIMPRAVAGVRPANSKSPCR